MGRKLEKIVKFPVKEPQFCEVCEDKLKEGLVVHKKDRFYHLLCAHKDAVEKGSTVFGIIGNLQYIK